MDLIKTGKEILNQALQTKVDDAEVYLLDSRSTTIEVKQQKIDAFEVASSRGVGLRVFSGKRMGFSYSSLSDGSEIQSLIKNTLSAVEHVEDDPYYNLPAPQPAPKGDLNIYDPSIQKVTEEEKIERAMTLEKAAMDTDKRIQVVRKAGYYDSEFTIHLMSSKGSDFSYQGTSCSASIMLMADDGNHKEMGWDADSKRFYSDLDVTIVGRRAAENAVSLLGAKTVPTRKCSVLFSPIAAISFLKVFISAFSADSVQKGKSLFRDKKGEIVASRAVTLIDDGLLPGGIGTAPFDDEGIPAQQKFLIREGVLEGFLHNSYTAAKAGESSTGNGVRSGYATTPNVGPSNLFVEKGPHSREQIIGGIKNGIEVTEVMGMHMANPISGDFSVGVSGIWIENGRPSHPVRGGVIAGNLTGLLQKVEGVGDDLRFLGPVGSPSLLIGDLSVSGE